MYFSSLFPYVVLVCFLVRGLLLRGAVDGIMHMFTPKVRVSKPSRLQAGSPPGRSHPIFPCAPHPKTQSTTPNYLRDPDISSGCASSTLNTGYGQDSHEPHILTTLELL